MEFTLFYQGLLPATGSLKEKHAIRKALAPQIREVCEKDVFANDQHFLNHTIDVGAHRFFALARHHWQTYAELDLLFLRPGPLGGVLAQGGDIDNRLKTLFDALRCPKEAEIRVGLEPTADEQPFYCLLEDDQLVRSLSIKVDRLLVPSIDDSHVYLTLQIRIKGHELRYLPP